MRIHQMVQAALKEAVAKSAAFSTCRTYRYALWRGWDPDKPFCLFIGLNPSTADENNDDPTIRRCIGFAKAWGYGGLMMVNLFAVRATDPQEMMEHPAPVGPDNNRVIEELAEKAGVIVAAWGTKGHHRGRDKEVMKILGDMMCLIKTKDAAESGPSIFQRFVRWPRGRYNGQRITGVTVKMKIDLCWWNLKIGWNFGEPMLHAGPFHFWCSATYRA